MIRRNAVCIILYAVSLLVFIPMAILAILNERLSTTLISGLILCVSTKVFIKTLKETNKQAKQTDNSSFKNKQQNPTRTEFKVQSPSE